MREAKALCGLALVRLGPVVVFAPLLENPFMNTYQVLLSRYDWLVLPATLLHYSGEHSRLVLRASCIEIGGLVGISSLAKYAQSLCV